MGISVTKQGRCEISSPL